jgi:hypothetical protein
LAHAVRAAAGSRDAEAQPPNATMNKNNTMARFTPGH